MRSDFKKAILSLAFLIIGMAMCFALSEQDRYGAIVKRNAFGLREPEPPKPPPEPPPSIKVNLTGITTILSSKRVFLMVSEQGKPAETKMLREGERDGQLEVVSIDEVKGAVTVKICDKEMVLTFEKDGIKPPTTPAGGAPPVPGAPGVPSMPTPGKPAGGITTASVIPGTTFTPATGTSASATPGSALAAIGSTMPTRPVRTTGTETGVVAGSPATVPGTTPTTANVTVQTGGGTLSLKIAGTPQQPKLQPNWPPEQPVSAEEAFIIHEALRIKHQKEIEAGLLPPLPGEPIK